MTKILLFGFGPLPIEKLRLNGPSQRTWHFLKVLLDAGHEVCFVGGRPHQGVYPPDLPPIVSQRKENLLYHSVENRLWFQPTAIRAAIGKWPAECVIGVTTAGAALAAQLADRLPFWADLYGSIMAEAQMKALVYADDSYLAHFWDMERPTLDRADIISTLAERQKWAVVGELGLWGRLNQWTSGYDFVHAIPVANDATPYPAHPPFLRGVRVPPDAFICLHAGGYNTWTDVDALFQALESVMAAHPNVVFASAGGPIEGHDEITYRRFEKMIAASTYRDRFHLLGWLAGDKLESCYQESNVGLVTDRISYEALLGSRTRVLDWMRAGLPCVMSALPELAQYVVAGGAGLAYPAEDTAALTRCLQQCAADPTETAAMGRRARTVLETQLSYEATSTALLAWAAAPRHAPDFGQAMPRLVTPYRPPASAFMQAGGLLRVATRAWPMVSGLTHRLGLGGVERWLVDTGRHFLLRQRGAYRATFVEHHIPLRMKAGTLTEAPITVRNDAPLTWLSDRESLNPVNVSYHWLNPQGEAVVKEGVRTPLRRSVAQGQTQTLTLKIKPPPRPGPYQLQLDLVREKVGWFSDFGVVGPTVTVEVEA